MKYSYRMVKRLFISGIIAMAASIGVSAAVTSDFYKESSVLESGKWVKVGVDETGVYEISYSLLRQMGFADPSKVSVYGRGGRQLSESFVTNSGGILIEDDLKRVPILHVDEKIYFYGLGPEEITFETSTSYPTGGYFSRKSNNVYSKRGYYFLTDSKPIQPITDKSYYSPDNTLLEKGISYVYHELDSVQNNTHSGQLFWGESLNLPNLTERKWDVTMHDAIAGKGALNGVMECVIYGPETSFGSSARIRYGFDGFSGFSGPYQYSNSESLYVPRKPTVSSVEIPGQKGKVVVAIDNADDMRDYANLDFWVVSYQRSIPTMKGASGERLNQQLFALSDVSKNSFANIKLQDAASFIVLDVTTPEEPVRLQVNQEGPNFLVGVRNAGKAPVVVVFDTSQPQKQICGFETAYCDVPNQNLHRFKGEGAELVIITTPRFYSYAEQIADLHRQHDGIKVLVVNAEELYNEFSGGTPDPIAYRSFIKMLHLSDCKPKNVLLFGPLYADFRGLKTERHPSEGLIAYQSPAISISRGAHNINDYYGVMTDKYNLDYYEKNQVELGVGILPVKYETSAEIVVEKIKNYLEREDHAYFLNRFTAVGGVGDEHTHDIQIRDINTYLRGLDYTSTIYTPLAIDTYGYAEARKKFLNQINDGCSMFSYFGHGAEQFLGTNRLFFTAGDVFALRNKTLPLALFGGCQITNTDRGFRGLGETIVTDTPYGTIGSIVSARETWSGQNLEFFKQFFVCLYKEGTAATSAHRKTPVTIGEVYAKVKSASTYSNELAYQLICDPALIIPSIQRTIEASDKERPGESGITVTPGQRIKLTGKVTTADGTLDANFNGQVVVRLNEPEKVVAAGNIESKQDTKSLAYTYRDQQVTMVAGDVVNGVFDLDFHIPASLASFTGNDALMYICAYDPSTRIGAASCELSKVGSKPSQNEESADRVPPTVERLEFNPGDCSISVAVRDDVALNLSNNPLTKGFFLYLDGKELTEAHFVEPELESDKAYSKYIYVETLTNGEHTARLKVKDVAGNVTEQEIAFTYHPDKAMYAISRSDASNLDFTRISIEEGAPEKASLIILSAEGTEVWQGEVKGSSIDWNHEFISGGKVPAGHYKGYLIETGSGMRKGHSNTIDIPVI